MGCKVGHFPDQKPIVVCNISKKNFAFNGCQICAFGVSVIKLKTAINWRFHASCKAIHITLCMFFKKKLCIFLPVEFYIGGMLFSFRMDCGCFDTTLHPNIFYEYFWMGGYILKNSNWVLDLTEKLENIGWSFVVKLEVYSFFSRVIDKVKSNNWI